MYTQDVVYNQQLSDVFIEVCVVLIASALWGILLIAEVIWIFARMSWNEKEVFREERGGQRGKRSG